MNYFRVPYGIVLNKWDINPEVSQKIEKWSGEKFLGKISYDREVVNSIVNLRPVIVSKSKVKKEIKGIFEKNQRIDMKRLKDDQAKYYANDSSKGLFIHNSSIIGVDEYNE